MLRTVTPGVIGRYDQRLGVIAVITGESPVGPLRRSAAPSTRARPRASDARRPRGEVERGLGARRRLPLRSLGPARARVLDRHAAADRQRLAARRPRLLLHPHRHRRSLPADVRPRGLLPDGLGRQRPADRASRAEPLRRALRPIDPLRPRLPTTSRAVREGAGVDLAAELRRAVPAADRDRRASLRGAVAHARAVRRLVDDLHDDRQARPAHLPTLVPRPTRARRGLPARGADAVGRRLPDRRRAG